VTKRSPSRRSHVHSGGKLAAFLFILAAPPPLGLEEETAQFPNPQNCREQNRPYSQCLIIQRVKDYFLFALIGSLGRENSGMQQASLIKATRRPQPTDEGLREELGVLAPRKQD
jgi:hypothetical protein